MAGGHFHHAGGRHADPRAGSLTIAILVLWPAAALFASRAIDVLHYDLSLTVTPHEQSIVGSATLTIASLSGPCNNLLLDFADQTIYSVYINGVPADYRHLPPLLSITLPEPCDTFVVTVEYAGVPRNDGFGGLFMVQNYAFTVGQGIYSDSPSMLDRWVPCHNVPYDKASLDIRLTVPKPLRAFSNGVLVDSLFTDTTAFFHWRETHPIAPYLIAFAVGDYVSAHLPYTSSSGKPLPIQYHIFPSHLDAARKDLRFLPDMMAVFEKLFGSYPFDRYSMVEAYNRGAMEHQTMTTYSFQLFTGDNRYDYVVAHELAHHWWGNLVTCFDWKDIWLNEGFATYSEALYFENVFGKEFAASYMSRLAEEYFAEESLRGVFPIYNPSYYWGATVYKKGAWLLHMLRAQIGDDAFFETLRNYAAEYAYSAATSEDFVRLTERVSGQDLQAFFDQWLFQAGHPKLLISYRLRNLSGNYLISFSIEQRQWDQFRFSFPLEIEVVGEQSRFTFSLEINDRKQAFEFVLPEKPLAVLVDPQVRLLKSFDLIDSTHLATQPNDFVLLQNYPNPFTRGQSTIISFAVPLMDAPHDVELTVYDVLGRRIKDLFKQRAKEGLQTLRWDGSNDADLPVSSGVYWLLLRAGNVHKAHKMVLLEK